eukprot:TRINITY_DN19961_c0_g1_i1.p1 TRINITY_DN19961_c0_g1~~TRINITY_DN19961_c0_g1_i1.p1  ORF type:complete len:173 (-),score=30.22 TRINITY_DN19961_c0_g1_i1:68-586(-)
MIKNWKWAKGYQIDKDKKFKYSEGKILLKNRQYYKPSISMNNSLAQDCMVTFSDISSLDNSFQNDEIMNNYKQFSFQNPVNIQHEYSENCIKNELSQEVRKTNNLIDGKYLTIDQKQKMKEIDLLGEDIFQNNDSRNSENGQNCMDSLVKMKFHNEIYKETVLTKCLAMDQQ